MSSPQSPPTCVFSGDGDHWRRLPGAGKGTLLSRPRAGRSSGTWTERETSTLGPTLEGKGLMTRPQPRSSEGREARSPGKQPGPGSASLRPPRAPGRPEAGRTARGGCLPAEEVRAAQGDPDKEAAGPPSTPPPAPGRTRGSSAPGPAAPDPGPRLRKAGRAASVPSPAAIAQAFPGPGERRPPRRPRPDSLARRARASPPPRRPPRGSHNPPAAAPAAPGPARAPHASPPPWPYCSPAAVPGLQATPGTQAAPTHGCGVQEKPED